VVQWPNIAQRGQAGHAGWYVYNLQLAVVGSLCLTLFCVFVSAFQYQFQFQFQFQFENQKTGATSDGS
jgi:hypothetical protein